jgi:hypothetical protein
VAPWRSELDGAERLPQSQERCTGGALDNRAPIFIVQHVNMPIIIFAGQVCGCMLWTSPSIFFMSYTSTIVAVVLWVFCPRSCCSVPASALRVQ